MVFVGKHHHLADCRGYAYEHRIVAEDKIGRKLLPGEQVHHVDKDKRNNHPDNIKVFKSGGHHLHEAHCSDKNKKHPDEENVIIECACGCGVKFTKYDSSNRPRKFVSGHNGRKNGSK